MNCSSFVAGGLLIGLCFAPGTARALTKVACAGEQTTHSLHRENDPEYPYLMAMQLDADFKATTKMAPHGGGFLEGGGTNFTVGNFAHPQASVLNHTQENPKTYLKSEEFPLLVAFKPDLVVLGPFAWHDVLSGVPLTNFPVDLDALIAAVQAIDSKPRVALATPVPEGGADKADGFTQIDGLVRAAATAHQLPIIDVWKELTGKASLYQDDFHLTVEGRTHLATFVGQAVKTLAAAAPNPPTGGTGGVGGSASAGTGGSTTTGGVGGVASGGVAGDAGGMAGSTSAGATTTPNASGAGGAAVSGGGAAGTTSSTLDNTAPPSDSGCGCRATSSTPSTGTTLVAGALAAVSLWRRRRAARVTNN